VELAIQIRRNKMAGIDRVHGEVENPATLTGGYPMVFLKIADSSSGFTADTGGGLTAIVEGGFTVAIRAIQTIATIVYIGTRANAQFVIAVDGSTAQPTGPAYDADATPTLIERVEQVIEATATFGNTITVTDISGLVAGNLA
jgi:hypothetical protein